MLVVKIDSVGNIDWSKTYGGSDSDYGFSVCKGMDGGYLLAGRTQSDDGDVCYNHGSSDAWIVKIDDFGNIEWEKSFGGSGYEELLNIGLSDDNHYVLAAISGSDNGDITDYYGLSDFWILKINVSGEIIWQKSYGSSENDIPFSIDQTVDSGYIVAGRTEGNDGDVTENKGSTDFG